MTYFDDLKRKAKEKLSNQGDTDKSDDTTRRKDPKEHMEDRRNSENSIM